jgi:DivIVA domain-containing protein
MELTSQVLHDAEFREAKRGGYNTQDVDEFIERIAAAVERQEALVREARQRVQAAETRAAEAERRAEDSEHRTVGTAEADETLKRTLVLAQRTADAAIREAEERAARTIADAEDRASRMLSEAQETTANAYATAEAEARQSQAEARAKVLNELNELEAMRHQLRHDVELLERHLEQQRERVRVTIHDLQRLLDNPGALREAITPTFDEVHIPSDEPEPEATFDPEPQRSLGAMPPPPQPRRLVADPLPGAALEEDDWDHAAPPSWSEEVGGQPDESEYAPMPPAPRRRPPTPRVADGGGDHDEDAYLNELRKAMADDRPLGPRDEYDDEQDSYEDEPTVGRSRFGRRR